MPRFNSTNVYQNRSEIIFAKKIQNFQALGAPPPDLHASDGLGSAPHPVTVPPLQISGYAPDQKYAYSRLHEVKNINHKHPRF